MISFLIVNSCYFRTNRPKDLDFIIILYLKSLGTSVTAVENLRLTTQLLFVFTFFFFCSLPLWVLYRFSQIKSKLNQHRTHIYKYPFKKNWYIFISSFIYPKYLINYFLNHILVLNWNKNTIRQSNFFKIELLMHGVQVQSTLVAKYII